jgi:hypothetical protein
MRDSRKAYVFIGILVILIIVLKVLQNKSVVSEGYEENETDYTQKYTKQIEDYLKIEEQIAGIFNREMEEFITWKKVGPNASIEEKIKSLPNPDEYIKVIKKSSPIIDKRYMDVFDFDKNDMDKINAVTTIDLLPFDEKMMGDIKTHINKVKTEQQTAIDNMTLSSLSKFKQRAIKLQKYTDEIMLYMLKLLAKMYLKPKEPKTAKEFIEYELNKFTKPLWSPLKFFIERLSKLISIGPDGKKKYRDNRATAIAIKEISEKAGVSDLDKYYTLMTKTKGMPKVTMETFERLFGDPMGYVNIVSYLNSKFNELNKNINDTKSNKKKKKKEGFWGGYDLMIEGWEDNEDDENEDGKKRKSASYKREPELPDLETLKGRHVILKANKNKFKFDVEKLVNAQKKSQEMERKAKSGELMSEMVGNRRDE